MPEDQETVTTICENCGAVIDCTGWLKPATAALGGVQCAPVIDPETGFMTWCEPA